MRLEVLRDFLFENKVFLLTVIVNLSAIILSFIWAIDANKEKLEYEPIVTTLALVATLFGLTFINEKLSKPNIKVSLDTVLVQSDSAKENMLRLNVGNHSLRQFFIRSFYSKQLDSNHEFHFLYDGLTKAALKKITLEPGQSFELYLSARSFESHDSIDLINGIFIRDDIGREFGVKNDNIAKRVKILKN